MHVVVVLYTVYSMCSSYYNVSYYIYNSKWTYYKLFTCLINTYFIIILVNNPGARREVSDNSLIIKDLCKTCSDRPTGTDLGVIQCKAKNIHGTAYASGILNVLGKA